MLRFDRTSLRKYARPLGIAAVGAALLVAATAGIISGFGGLNSQDVIRVTQTPIDFHITRTATNTPTDTNTPTETNTPTITPTPFPTKDVDDLHTTVVVGGSTDGELVGSGTWYVPMFDGGGGGSFDEAGHVIFPGALTHLTIHISATASGDNELSFAVFVNGKRTSVYCGIPAKGKGDFCESGDKQGDCVQVGPQDRIAVQADAQVTSSFSFSMSWAAKLDLYGQCPTDDPAIIGQSSCSGTNACGNAQGRIGDNSCNGTDACSLLSGVVGTSSCNDARACGDASSRIANNSCNWEDACLQSFGTIGDSSCSGDNACFRSSATIGNGSCYGDRACAVSQGNIKNSSCKADLACVGTSGRIGSNSCNALAACAGNIRDIGENQCNTPNACQGP